MRLLGARIARWLKDLIGSLRRLGEAMRQLGDRVAQLRSGSRPEADATLHRGARRGAGPRQAITRASVEAIARKYHVRIDDLEIVINDRIAGVCGATHPDHTVELCRGAFRSEEDLARSLAHERFHVEELRSGQPYPKPGRERDAAEDRAYDFEDAWWDGHDIRPDQER